jgi:excisionase family DNA binding protein
MFYDEKAIAEVAARIAIRIIPQIREAGNGRVFPRLMTIKQAAEYTGRSVSSINHLVYRRQIPVVRVGRRVHIDRNDLDRWIESNKV